MLLFSKIYEFYCLYGIEILLSGATGAAHQNSYEGLHIFSYKALFPNCSHFFLLFPNSSYKALICILLMINHSTLEYHVTNFNTFFRGRLQRTSAKISDFQTTPSPCPGVSEFPKPPPSPDVRVRIFQFLHIFIFAH